MIRSQYAFLIVLALAVPACKKAPPAAKKKDLSPVKVAVSAVRFKQIQRSVESVGTLFPYEEVLISAEIEGKVDQVNVDLGDRVTPGQVLVQISDEEQLYILAQNEAQLRMSLERLGLKNEADRVTDVRQTPEVRRAEAERFEAEQRYKRVRELVEQGIGAKTELDQASGRYQAASAAFDATINQARNLVQEVERFKAVVDLQRKKLRDTSVRAPFAASVKERQVSVGLYVRPNTPLLTLVKTDPIRLRLDVPERMAPWVKEGQVADVSVEAFLDRKFQGRIWRISPTVDQSKRTFVVEALIANPNAALKPGSYARARVPTNKIEQTIVVPGNAINYVLGANKAFVISSGVVDARDVKLGDRFDQDVEILEGLKEGEMVATTQLARLDTGTRVEVAGEPPARADTRASE
jgi:RND family efflux transporter MFP subunit